MGQSQGSSHHQNDVTPEQLQNLVRTTGYSKSDIQDMYAKFQRDFPKGYIDEKVFRAVYASMYPMGCKADRFSRHVFRIYDTDGNGQISFADYATTLHVAARGSADDKLKAAFRFFDIDRRGFITQKELRQMTTAIYISKMYPNAEVKGKKEAEKIMQQLDANRNNRLSEREFVQAGKSCPKLLQLLQGRQ